MSVEDFVKSVNQFLCIYNKESPDYGREDTIEAAWNEIANKIEWSVTDCKKQWNHILDDYSKFLKDIKEYNGESENLYCKFKDLRFLLPYDSKPVINVGTKRQKAPSPLQEREGPPAKKFKVDSEVEGETSFSDDEFENKKAEVIKARKMFLFLLSLLADLENLSDKKQSIFKIKALKLLQYYKE